MNTKLDLLHLANLLYLLIGAASLLIAVRPLGGSNGGLPQGLDPAVMMIAAQVGGVLIPALLFLWLTRQPIFSALKLRQLSFGTGLKCFVAGVLCYPVFLTLGNLSLILLTLVGGSQAGASLNVVTSGGSPWIAFLGMVLVAPLFEEILFRGVLMSAYEGRVGSHAIWMVAILFSFYHFTPEMILGVLFMGLLLGWVVYRTRSIWAGILLHFGANLVGGLFSLLVALAVSAGAEAAAQGAALTSTDLLATLWMSVMIWGGTGLILLVPVFFLLRSIGKRFPVPERPAIQLGLRTTWSTLVVLLAALAYFGTQLASMTGP